MSRYTRVRKLNYVKLPLPWRPRKIIILFLIFIVILLKNDYSQTLFYL